MVCGRFPLLLLLAALLVSGFSGSVEAEVRFGKNVRIGGHDASNQTFTAQRRGEYYIHNGKPRNEGCRWRANRDGARTRVCHLQRK